MGGGLAPQDRLSEVAWNSTFEKKVTYWTGSGWFSPSDSRRPS